MHTSLHEIAVFGSSATAPTTPEWDAAVRCGRLLAEAGFAVVTGGYGGVMEAVSSGAAAVGGHVVGVIAPAVFPNRAGANPHVAEVVEADTLTQRIHHIVDRISGAVVLPGSLGTLAELMVAWNAAYVAPCSGRAPMPVVAVGPTWRRTVSAVVDNVGAPAELVHVVDSVDAAVATIAASVR